MSAFSGLVDIPTPSGSKSERHIRDVRFLCIANALAARKSRNWANRKMALVIYLSFDIEFSRLGSSS